MKKIILVFLIAFGFTINTNAQEAKVNEPVATSEVSVYVTKANSDVKDITPFIKMTTDSEKMLFGLFKAKHKMLYNAKDEESKATIKQGIEMKLVSIIGREAVIQLKTNTSLFEKLMN